MKRKQLKRKILSRNLLRETLFRCSFLLLALMVGTAQLSASSEAQEVKVSLNVQNQTIADVFSAITEQTGLKFFFNDTQLDVNRRVTVNALKEPFSSVLRKILAGTGYSYEAYKKQVVIVKEKQEESKERIISGVVTDDSGVPLPGVSVVLKGTKLGVATDIDGNFELRCPKSSGKLLFSFIGTIPKEVPLSKKSHISVVLEEDTEVLEEIVVTGYQKLNINQAAGAFNKVDMKEFEKRLSPDVTSSLEGLSSSLVISHTPGSSSKELTIRGISTLQGSSSPLIIVDGFPYSGGLSSINAYEIESITLLKDAASASIYGAKSANGVIVITTKRGQRGNLKIHYMNTMSFSQKPDIEYVMNRVSSSDFVDIGTTFFNENKSNLNSYQHYVETGNMQANRHIRTHNRVIALHIAQKEGRISQAELDRKLAILRTTDNTAELKRMLLQTPFSQQHNLSASYGSDGFRMRTSLSYYNNKSGFRGTKGDGFMYNLNSIIDVSKRFTLDLAANFNFNRGERFTEGASRYFDLSSYESLYDEQGNPLSVTRPSFNPGTNSGGRYGGKQDYAIQQLKNIGLLDETYYPAADYGRSKANSENWGARFQAQMKMKILEDLKGILAFNVTKGAGLGKSITDKNSWEMRSWINNLTGKTDDNKKDKLYVPMGSRIVERRTDNTNYLLRGQLDYDKKIKENQQFIAIVGSEIQANKKTGTSVDRLGYDEVSNTYRETDYERLSTKDIPKVFHPNGSIPGGVRFSNSFSENENRYFSLYSNFNYLYSTRYVLSGSLRIDQSNLFGTDPKYRFKPMWSVGSKWRIAEENFFTSSLFSNLDLQMSYGINGNISHGQGPFDIALDTFAYRADNARALTFSSYAVPDLRWEKTETFNIGLHSRLLNDRISFSFDYYRKNTKDLLANAEGDPTLGSNFIMRNDATISNNGYEFTLQTLNLQTGDFKWSTFLNLNYNKSKVEKIYEREERAYSIAGRIRSSLGYEPNSIFVFEWAGVDDKGNGLIRRGNGDLVAISPSNYEGGTFHPYYTPEIADLKHAGTVLPKMTSTMTNNFSYKNLSLSFMFVYQGGHIMLRDGYNGQDIGSNTGNPNKELAKAWKKKGDEKHTDVPRQNSARYSYSIARNSTKNIIEGDFIRLRDIVLSYTLPKDLLSRVGVQEVTINLRGKNLWLWTKNPYGIDTETQGLGYRGFPVVKSFSAGLNVTF